MKRNATTAELTNIDQQEAKRLSRMQLEAIAQVAMREGLSKEQVAYEQWIDTQPIEEVLSWDEMGEEERKGWCLEHLGEDVEGIEEGQRGGLGERVKEGERVEEEHAVVEHCVEEERQDEAVGDLGESRWIAVRTVKEQLAHEALVVSQEENSSLSPGTFNFFSPNVHVNSENCISRPGNFEHCVTSLRSFVTDSFHSRILPS
jgi:hypothetical protein